MHKKWSVIIAPALAVSACGPSSNGNSFSTNNIAPQLSIVDRLKNGDTGVCADPDVEATWINIMAGDANYKQFQATGIKIPPLTAVSATGVKKDIGEISCAGNFDGGPGFLGGPTDARAEFTVRPSVDQPGGYVVEANGLGREAVTSWVIGRIVSAHKSDKQAPPPPAQTDTTTDANAVGPLPDTPDPNPQESSSDSNQV